MDAGRTAEAKIAMIPRRIMNASHWLGAPAGWKPDKDGDCGHLAIRTRGNPRGGTGWCESAWEPTPAELAELNKGGSIILRVIGWQPPVALYVEKAEHAQEPVEAAMVAPTNPAVCPRCELEVGALTPFCQNKECPMRGPR